VNKDGSTISSAQLGIIGPPQNATITGILVTVDVGYLLLPYWDIHVYWVFEYNMTLILVFLSDLEQYR
jgi:hypothetical protein